MPLGPMMPYHSVGIRYLGMPAAATASLSAGTPGNAAIGRGETAMALSVPAFT